MKTDRQTVHRWIPNDPEPPPPHGFFRGFLWAFPVSVILWLALLEAFGLI